MMTFKEKLVVLRKMKNLTQDEFASAVGVSRQAVYKWESGHSYPEAMKLWEIKLLFDISIDNLLDDTFEIELPKKKRRRRAKPATDAVAAEAANVEAAPVAEVKKEETVAEPVTEVNETVTEANTEEVKPAEKTETKVEESVATETEEEVEETETEEEVEEEVEIEDVLPPVTAVPENPDRVSDLLQKKGFFGRLFGKK